MAKYFYCKMLDDIGKKIYSGGEAKYEPRYLSENGSEVIGTYSGVPNPRFKCGPYKDTATMPSYVRIKEEGRRVSYTIDWIYDQNCGGYHVYRLESTEGNTTKTTYHLSFEEALDDSLLSGSVVNIWENGQEVIGETNDTDSVYDGIEASAGYQVDLESIMRFDTVWANETNGEEYFSVNNILGVFGIPYQFMPHVDPRLRYKEGDTIKAGTSAYLTDTQGTGIEYADHIAAHMPILFLSPGIPNFMSKFSSTDKQTILDFFAQSVAGIANNLTPDELLKDSGKYYTFEYAVDNYYKHVNPMCRIAAAYMEVANYTWDGVRMDSVNWMNYTMSKLSGIFQGRTDITDYTAIPFYIESETQISESFSNDVTDSSLASTIDSVSNLGKEAMFILGYSQAALNTKILEVDADSATTYQNVVDSLGFLANGNGFITNIINNLASVATGGRLIFPKIWNDSSFSRSYDISIKLRSPDMDNLSIYLNIIVPFLHLLGFMLPRQISGNPNGFFSPFLVRAIYKGFFNVDMGMVTSMSVTKGDQSQWNANGIPTAIDINMTITDLYENISMTPTDATSFKYDTMDNTCQMDYLATLCGINIYQPEIGRTLRMWFTNNFTNRIRDVIDVNVWGNIQNSLANAVVNVWRGKSL